MWDLVRCVWMYIFLIYNLNNFYLLVIKLINGWNYALASVKIKLLQVKRNRGSIYRFSLTTKICLTVWLFTFVNFYHHQLSLYHQYIGKKNWREIPLYVFLMWIFSYQFSVIISSTWLKLLIIKIMYFWNLMY